MSARAKARRIASQLCLVILGAALALAAVVTLSTRVDTSDESATQEGHLLQQVTKKSETLLHERRDFVTLKDIQAVGAAAGRAAADLVSRCDDHFISAQARPSWPPIRALPAAPTAPAHPKLPPTPLTPHEVTRKAPARMTHKSRRRRQSKPPLLPPPLQSHNVPTADARCSMPDTFPPRWEFPPSRVPARKVTSRVALIMITRDKCHQLQRIQCHIDFLLDSMPNAVMIIYEDNSVDCTAEFIRAWAHNRQRVFVTSVVDGKSHASAKGALSPSRFRRLATLRDKATDAALSAHSPETVMVVDSDLVRGFHAPFVLDAIQAVSDGTYKTVCANSVVPEQNWRHYDSLALRFDWNRREHNNHIFAAQNTSTFDGATTRVLSCFGGLAIYDASVFRNCSYSGLALDDCEHANLHRCLEASGGSMYLLHNMLVIYNAVNR